MPAPHPRPLLANLRRHRLRKGWTQEQLAAESGVDQATISSLEVGRVKSPAFDTISRLAKALGIDAEEVVETRRRRATA
jgi:transcriptional regulator with XRE-family HTH domain